MFSLSLTGKNQHRTGMLFAFGSLISLGTYSALAKGLTPFLSPVSLLLISELLTAMFVVLTFGLFPLLRAASKLTWKIVAIAAAIGLLNSAAAPLLWFKGLQQTTAVNASMLSSGDVIAVLIFGHFLLREHISHLQQIGVSIIIAGILVINLGGMGTSLGLHSGDLLILLATQVSGLGSVLFKKYLSHILPEVALIIRNLAGCAVVLIISVTIGYGFTAEFVNFPSEKLLLLVCFGFFSRYLGLSFFYQALDRLPVTTLALVEIAMPLAGLFFAVLLLGEQIQEFHVLGGLLIMTGLLVEQTTKGFWSMLSVHRLMSTFRLRMRSREQAMHLLMRFSKHG